MIVSVKNNSKYLFHRGSEKWKWRSFSLIQSCPTLWDPMDHTVHGILQARILEWVAFPFSRGSSQPTDGTQVSCIAGGFFTSWATMEALIEVGGFLIFFVCAYFSQSSLTLWGGSVTSIYIWENQGRPRLGVCPQSCRRTRGRNWASNPDQKAWPPDPSHLTTSRHKVTTAHGFKKQDPKIWIIGTSKEFFFRMIFSNVAWF